MGRPTPEKPEAHDHRDLVEMWNSLLDGAWNSLAVVPSDHLVSMDPVVESLNAVDPGAAGRVQVLDARGFDVAQGQALASEIASAVAGGKRTVVFVDSLMRSLSGAQVVRDVNAVLLVMRVGGLDIDSMTSTLDLVGAERVVGAVSAGGHG